jgi:hypothetical protein
MAAFNHDCHGLSCLSWVLLAQGILYCVRCASPVRTYSYVLDAVVLLQLQFGISSRLLPTCVVESSLQVSKTTYSALQEHRSIQHTATGQKAKPQERMSTETTDTGNSSKTPEACRREAEEDMVKTAVEHGGAQIEQARPQGTTVKHQQAEGAQLAGVKQNRRNTSTQGRIGNWLCLPVCSFLLLRCLLATICGSLLELALSM